MDPFTAISMGISVVGGVTKMIDGFAKKKAAEERMRKLEAAPLPLNAFEALQLPQEGIKDRRESLERQKMDTVARLQQGGTRALAANLGKVNEQGIQAERQIGIDTDDAMFRKNQMIANEQANIYDVQEQRLSGAMSSTASDIAEGTAAAYGGMQDLAQVGLAIGQNNDANDAQLYGSQGGGKSAAALARSGERAKRITTRGGTVFGVAGRKAGAKIGGLFKSIFKK